MQILPETAYFIAHLSGGTQFTASDLATPSINVAYGTLLPALPARPLRRQRDARGRGVQRGPRRTSTAGSRGRAPQGTTLTVSAIPFPETQAYVERVLAAQRDYRASDARQLGSIDGA